MDFRGSESPASAEGASVESEGAAERTVRCAACGHTIALERDRTSVGDAPTHTFKNPAGIDYTVGCFRDAPGCRGVGAWSAVWTWFPGHSWRVALCARCGEHLGWAFARGDAAIAFFALVLDRLA